MRKVNSDEVKDLIFDILCEFDRICKQNNLKYYLSDGTLLGAIRYKDFIPWDDDIDLSMPRPDYEKFKQIFDKENSKEYYELATIERNNLVFPFMKIYDNRTIVKSKYVNTNSKLWIDIFPLDGLPNSEKECTNFMNYNFKIKKCHGFASAKFGTGKTRFKAICKIPIITFCHILGNKHFAKKLINRSRQYRYENSNYVANTVWPNLGMRLLKKELEKEMNINFHGKAFPTTHYYDEYLTQMYGSDYMTPPPENKRETHDCEAFIEDTL